MSNKYWGWGLEDDEFFVRYRYAIIFGRKICKITISLPDTGSGVFLTPGWVKNLDPDPGYGILKFFDADPDPGSGNLLALYAGSGINIPDPQH